MYTVSPRTAAATRLTRIVDEGVEEPNTYGTPFCETRTQTQLHHSVVDAEMSSLATSLLLFFSGSVRTCIKTSRPGGTRGRKKHFFKYAWERTTLMGRRPRAPSLVPALTVELRLMRIERGQMYGAKLERGPSVAAGGQVFSFMVVVPETWGPGQQGSEKPGGLGS